MSLFRRVLIALSGGSADLGLLEYGGLLRDLAGGAELVPVHVAQPGRQLPTVPAEILSGDRSDALVQAALQHSADLILMGRRTAAPVRGSLARRIAMTAPCSIWMVPDGSPATIGHILAPVDFSRRSADALSLAAEIAARAGMDEIGALHVHFNDAAVSFDEYGEIVAGELQERFSIFSGRIDLHGVDARPLLVESPDVAHSILRAARERGSSLIVMSTRGRSRSAAVLLGSETEHVLMESTCPVLAVKHYGARMRFLEALLDKRTRQRGRLRYT